MKNTKLVFKENVLEDYDFEYGRDYFGESLFVEPRSNKQVYDSLSKEDYAYFKEICSIKKLTLEAQWELMAEALEHVERGNKIPDSIREKLIMNGMAYVSSLAFSYLCKYKTSYTYGDFISEGYQALCKAFDKWLQKTDEEKTKNIVENKTVFASFNTFAFNWIKDAYANMIAKDKPLSMSLSSQKKVKTIIRAKASFIKRFGKVPTDKELAEYSGFEVSVIENSKVFLTRVQPSGEVHKEDIYLEVINSHQNNIDEEQENKLRTRVLDEYLKKILNKAEYEVITLWFLKGYTIKDIAKKLGVSVNKANTLKDNALNNLQKNAIILKQAIQK